jgi:hypothetical protein
MRYRLVAGIVVLGLERMLSSFGSDGRFVLCQFPRAAGSERFSPR